MDITQLKIMATPIFQQANVSAHQPAAQEQQRQPQPGAQPDKAESRGGFDCEFVERPPEVFQSECPVCLQIVRDPYQVTCCGYSFCRSCIERIKADNKPCPTCNENGFSDFPNKGLKRSLYAFKVRCSHQKDGCEWMGELGQLDVHLNKDPPPEKRVCGCPLTAISCDFVNVGCLVKLPRKDMPEHLRENLLTHTSLLAVSHASLASSHAKLASCNDKQQAQITELLVENNALRIKNIKLEQNHHFLETNSDNFRVKFASLQESHTALSTSLAGLQGRLSASHAELQGRLSASHAELQGRIKDVTAEVNSLKVSHDGLIAYNLQNQETALVEKTKVSATDRVIANRVKIPLVPSAVIMNNFQQHKKDKGQWYSPPFYTHYQGYKICLRVDANGDGSGKGTHISVFVYFMKGEFDDFLNWPFRGVIVLQLVDQLKGVDHETYSLMYNDSVHDKFCSRVIYGHRSSDGWGKPSFLVHSQLSPKFLRNNTLQFQVCDGEVLV